MISFKQFIYEEFKVWSSKGEEEHKFPIERKN